MMVSNRLRSRACRASFVRPLAFLVAVAVLLALVPPAEASHKAPYIIRDSDGDLWLDAIEKLLGTSRYDADSDPVDLDGNCAVGALPADPPTADPDNATNGTGGEPDDAQPCPLPITPEELPLLNATEDLPVPNATEDLPLPNATDAPDPATPEAPQPNVGTPCDIEGWPGCESDRDYPSGRNDGARDDDHDENESPQSNETGEPDEDPNEVDEALEEANETAEPAHNATKPVVKEVRATMNETSGLVDVTWVVGEDDDQSDADRYAVYRDDGDGSVNESGHRQGQTSYRSQDRSHPEGNVTYRVVPIYETANGTVQGNGTSSPPEEFEPFPDGVGEEIRKCGPEAIDTDLDAICDAAEEVLGTNPFALDSDGDGIPDPLALRLGLVGPRQADAGHDDEADDQGDAASDLTPQEAAPAGTPTLVHGVLGLGATLMAGAVGAIVRFRRP